MATTTKKLHKSYGRCYQCNFGCNSQSKLRQCADALPGAFPATISFVGAFSQNLAPGEARTPDLRISLSVLTYKYDALTDCATGVMVWELFSLVQVLKKF